MEEGVLRGGEGGGGDEKQGGGGALGDMYVMAFFFSLYFPRKSMEGAVNSNKLGFMELHVQLCRSFLFLTWRGEILWGFLEG